MDVCTQDKESDTEMEQVVCPEGDRSSFSLGRYRRKVFPSEVLENVEWTWWSRSETDTREATVSPGVCISALMIASGDIEVESWCVQGPE